MKTRNPDSQSETAYRTQALGRIQALRVLVAMAMIPSGLAAEPTLFWGGGDVDVNPNTVPGISATDLSGIWNTSTQNWADHYFAPNTYGAFQAGAVANFGRFADASANALISLQESLALGGMVGNLDGPSAFNRAFVVQAPTPQTLTLNGPVYSFANADDTRGIVLDTNVTLAGSSPLVKDGRGKFELLGNNNAFTGQVIHRSGRLVIGPNATLAGVSDIRVEGYATLRNTGNLGGNEFSNPTLFISAGAGANSKFNNDLLITLTRGTIRYSNGSLSTETIGRIDLSTWGILNFSEGNNAGGWLILSDATQGLTRGPQGLGTLHIETQENAATRAQLRITNPGALPVDQVLPWATSNRGQFMRIDSSQDNALVPATSVSPTLDLGQWASTYSSSDNLRVQGVLTGAADSTTVQTLAFNHNVASTLTLNAEQTLTLAAGGILNHSIAAVTHSIVGGRITTPASTLYVATGTSNQGGLTFNTVVDGSFDLVKSGVVTLNLAGANPNTYTGTTYVQGGGLTVAKSPDIVGIPGDLVIATGGSVSLSSTGALGASSNVTVARDAVFNIGSVNTVGGTLTMNGGQTLMVNTTLTLSGPESGLAFNGGYFSHNSSAAGTVNLLTNLSYGAEAQIPARFDAYSTGLFSINLNTGSNAEPVEREFAVARNLSLPEGQAEVVVAARLANGGTGSTSGGLRKTGEGTLQLTVPNTYTGATVIDGGTLHLATIAAAGRTGVQATGGSALAQTLLTFYEPIARSFVIGQGLSSALPTPRTGRVAEILNDYQLILAGNSFQNQIYTDITFDAYSTSGTLAGEVFVNDGGRLLLDPGTSVAGQVQVQAGGTLAGSGLLSGNVSIAPGGTLSPGQSPGLLTIGGNLNLGGNLLIEIDGPTRGTDFDAIDVGEAILYGGVLTASIGQSIEANSSFSLFSFASQSGQFNQIEIGGIYQATLTADNGFAAESADGRIWTFHHNVGSLEVVIPEPGFYALFIGLGLALAVTCRRRRK